MNYILPLILILLIPINLISQSVEYDERINQVIITDIIEIQDKLAEEIFKNATSFLSTIYTHGDKLILNSSISAMYLTSSGQHQFNFGDKFYWSIKVDIKDGRLRYVISDIHSYAFNNKVVMDSKAVIKGRSKIFKKIGDTFHSELTSYLSSDLVTDDDW